MDAQNTLCVLCAAWQTIKDCFDLTAELPGWDSVLSGVDLAHPVEAAGQILVNLLLEAMEQVNRFSPWYKASPEAFGLHRIPGTTTAESPRLRLTSEAMEQWHPTLDVLARAIADELELPEIQTTIESTKWMSRPLVAATCACKPDPPITWVPPYTLLDAALYCSICGQPLHRVEQAI